MIPINHLFNEAKAELVTLRDYLRFAMSCFQQAGLVYGHGTDNAFDEALYLLLHALHLPVQLDERLLEARLTSSERNRLLELLHKRVNERIPTAYLVQEAWFAGLSFYVDERVLIPRSPIAELINQAFSPWLVNQQAECILDLCTGSGCIAIACAYAFPDAHVDAVDISADALMVAKINLERHQLEERVNLIEASLFSGVAGKRYDVIVSNPPYVDAANMSALPSEYRHEPELALTAGDDGLALALPILQQATQYLQPDGILVLEVGDSAHALTQRFPQVPFYWPEFSHGGEGVLILSAEQLKQYEPVFIS